MRQKTRHPPSKVALVNQNGRFTILGIGTWQSFWRDPYHLLTTISWRGFLTLTILTYIATNALFALAYLAGGNCIAHAQPGSFLDAFFFSVQTMATIGYGDMYPQTAYANILVTIEALVGMLGLAMMTGLAFSRFSRPTARVIFSQVAVIAPFDGIPTLMFRTANKRRNQILEAEIRVRLTRDEITREGDFMRRVYDLRLLRSQNPIFSLSWTALHPIDEQSPLYEVTPETLAESATVILVTLRGLDETVSQTIYARHSFAAHEILWNMRFVDILCKTAEGDRYLDYSRFHDVKPVMKM